MNRFLIYFLFPLLSFSQSTLDIAEQLILQKNYLQGEQLLTSFVVENPNNRKAIELLGDVFGYQEKWDQAIVEYKKNVEADPKVANYHYKYGGALAMKALSISKIRALLIIGDVKSAFLRAAELDPEHINTRWALVELYMQLPSIIGGSISKSLIFANELEGLSKVDGYLSKGYIYEYDDKPELAEEYYKKAIKEGGSLTCFNTLSIFYEAENQPKKAILNIEKTQTKHHRNALYYQLGKVCAEYNLQLEKGEHCLTTYIENYSSKDGVPIAWANYRLAQIHKHKGNKAIALEYIDLAILELPEILPFKVEKNKILNL